MLHTKKVWTWKHDAEYVPNANFWHFVALKYPGDVKIWARNLLIFLCLLFYFNFKFNYDHLTWWLDQKSYFVLTIKKFQNGLAFLKVHISLLCSSFSTHLIKISHHKNNDFRWNALALMIKHFFLKILKKAYKQIFRLLFYKFMFLYKYKITKMFYLSNYFTFFHFLWQFSIKNKG